MTEWPPIGKIAAHSAYDVFSWYKYLIVNLVFPTSVFGVGIFFYLRLFLVVAYLYLFITVPLVLSDVDIAVSSNITWTFSTESKVVGLIRTRNYFQLKYFPRLTMLHYRG